MKRNLILSIIACGASLALCLGLQAQDAAPAASASGTNAAGGGHQWGHGGAGQLARLTTALSLTPDQQTQIKPIVDTFHTAMQSVKQDSSLALTDKRAKIKDARDTETSQINAILTPDQQTKFAALQAQMRNHHRDGAQGEVSPSPATTP